MSEESSKGTDGGPTAPKKEGGVIKKNGQSGAAKGFAPRAPKFEGKCPDLKGHIYDASDARQSDQFIKTTREIGEFVGRTYKYGGDIRLAVEKLSIPFIIPPADHSEDATKTEIRIWENLSTSTFARSLTFPRTSSRLTRLSGDSAAMS